MRCKIMHAHCSVPMNTEQSSENNVKKLIFPFEISDLRSFLFWIEQLATYSYSVRTQIHSYGNTDSNLKSIW